MTPPGAMYDLAQTDPEERYASDFAAALLMPEATFRAAWSQADDDDDALLACAQRFAVAPEAVRYRLAMLGIVTGA